MAECLIGPGSVYVDETGRSEAQRQNGRLYESLKIRSDLGAAIVVRPDGIMAMVSGLTAGNVDRIVEYFDAL